MAMDTTQLRDAMVAELDARLGAAVGSDAVLRANICDALAVAIVGHIQGKADVRISTGAAGLQRDASTGDATLAPAVDVVLSQVIE
jgi:hypothetical protein